MTLLNRMCHYYTYLPFRNNNMKTVFKPRVGKGKGGIIQLNFNYGTNKRFRYSTGLNIENLNNWDFQKCRIKNVISEPHKAIINNKLNLLQTELEREFINWSVADKNEVNNQILKEFCDRFFDKSLEEKEKHYEFLPFYEWYIKTYTNNPLPTTGRPMAHSTKKTYTNSYNLIKRFATTNYELEYNKITKEFYYDFLDWLFDQDYSNSYIGTQIKVLKTMMEASLELDFHQNRIHRKKFFKKPSSESDSIYLNELELEKIHRKSFVNHRTIILNNGVKLTADKLERAKDIFLISSFTGLRIGDTKRLNSNHIISLKGKEYFQLKTNKTNHPLSIPIHPIVKDILNKRHGELPERIPDQHINYALKKIGELAGIEEEFEKKVTKGGVVKSNIFKKYELICTHTGRRSFCTNAYHAGVVVQDIMTISGHRTEKSFMLYLKLGESQKAEKIGEHPFFN